VPALSHRIHIAGQDYRERPLIKHLTDVGESAAAFAHEPVLAAFARQAGRWHDLGKYSQAFQDYLHAKTAAAGDPHLGEMQGRVDHSTAGAIHAVAQIPGPIGQLLAYVIAGHHAGLPDWQSAVSDARSHLSKRLQRDDLLAAALAGDVDAAMRPLAQVLPGPRWGNSEDVHLWIRMLFSCLVDADRLDAEIFARQTPRDSKWPTLDELSLRLDAYLRELKNTSSAAVAVARSEVLAHCRAGAAQSTGLFSLTVPTGGGKTLSSLAFALAHARAHGLRRVIYVIPYLSIIEQTADVFRKALGNDALVEHHSSVLPQFETQQTQWAVENWDASLIVTTSVQFFESLFSAHPSTCRKLHRIAGSVVILDEAQLISLDHLKPILSALRSLCRCHRTSIVFATATQPAFSSPRLLEHAALKQVHLSDVRELIPDPARLYQALRRTRIEWPGDTTPVTWPDLADRLAQHPQVLCVVSRRKDARDLYELLKALGAGAIHLSALMCADHRSVVIARIRAALARGEPLRVVSTQLIEAGVDVDFPVVYRAFAGLDSIAQAAGRCNRNGNSDQLGRVIVFWPPTKPPRGLLTHAAAATAEILRTAPDADPLSPAAFDAYFPQLYMRRADHLDSGDILKRLTQNLTPSVMKEALDIPFRSVAADFQLIEERDDVTIFVPFAETSGLLESLKAGNPSRELLRKLQRCTVSLPRKQVEALHAVGQIDLVQEGWWVLHPDAYDLDLGVRVDDGPDGSFESA
jgi:CRISPR-associated endonuclease/helicase Cas3